MRKKSVQSSPFPRCSPPGGGSRRSHSLRPPQPLVSPAGSRSLSLSSSSPPSPSLSELQSCPAGDEVGVSPRGSARLPPRVVVALTGSALGSRFKSPCSDRSPLSAAGGCLQKLLPLGFPSLPPPRCWGWFGDGGGKGSSRERRCRFTGGAGCRAWGWPGG